jgi:hypothetical protein
VLSLVAGTLAACGGGGGASTSTTTSLNSQVESAYVNFFSSKSSLATRVGLLQNGSKFKSVIEQFAGNPLAKNVKVVVSSVTPQGANEAKVVYVVKLGSAGLPKQTGIAVRQNGIWKVGDASLCKLMALQGSTPSACKS